MNPDDKKRDPRFIHAAGPYRAVGLREDTSPLLDSHNAGTFTVITGDSIGVSVNIHDRRPMWLAPGQAKEWFAAAPDAAMAIRLAGDVPAMEAYPVSRAFTTPRNDVEALLQPAGDWALRPEARMSSTMDGGASKADRDSLPP